MNLPLAAQRSRTSVDGTPASSGQISKAAFFRARPPNVQQAQLSQHMEDVPTDFGNPSEGHRYNDSAPFTDNRSQESQQMVPNPMLGTMSPPATQGHSPATNYEDKFRPLESNSSQVPVDAGRQKTGRYRSSDSRMEATYAGSPTTESTSALHHSSSRASSRLGQGGKTVGNTHTGRQSSSTFISGESAELLMSLLAGQAAVDCQGLPVSRWEEVDEWKKELSMLTSRLDQQISRHQREQKILTAAKTLAKLNSHNKRMSKQTSDSVEVAEQKVADAEKEMLNLQGREGAVRRALMEHQAGVLTWELRRLEQSNRVAEERAARYRKEAEEVKELRLVAQRVSKQDTQLADCYQRIEELESVISDIRSKESNLLRKIEELESEKFGWRKDRDALNKEVETIRRESKTLSAQSATYSRSKTLLANALEQPRLEDISEMAEAARKLVSSNKRKDEELKVLREEMREVNMGMEKELSRVAADRDTYKERLEELDKEATEGKRSTGNRLTEMEDQFRRQAETVKRLESENAEMHAALAAAENQAWNRAANVSGEESKELEALRREMDVNDVVMEDLWTVLPTPGSRRATGLIDVVTDKLKSHVSSPAMDCKPEALRALFDAAPPTRREEYAGAQEAVRRVKTLIEDSRVIVERTIQAAKERELFKSNTARAQRLVEESQSSLATYQRQVNILEAKLKKAREESKPTSAEPELGTFERRLRDAEAAKRKAEVELVKQEKACLQLAEANKMLTQRAVDATRDLEREKAMLQSRYQKEFDELNRKLRDGDDDMEKVLVHEQNQRLQLLDELNSAQEKIDKLNMQLRARGG